MGRGFGTTSSSSQARRLPRPGLLFKHGHVPRPRFRTTVLVPASPPGTAACAWSPAFAGPGAPERSAGRDSSVVPRVGRSSFFVGGRCCGGCLPGFPASGACFGPRPVACERGQGRPVGVRRGGGGARLSLRPAGHQCPERRVWLSCPSCGPAGTLAATRAVPGPRRDRVCRPEPPVFVLRHLHVPSRPVCRRITRGAGVTPL